MLLLLAQILLLLIGDHNQQFVDHFAGLLLLRDERLLQFLDLLGEELNPICVIIDLGGQCGELP